VASPESSAHQAFKNKIIHAVEGETKLSLKALTPVRLLKNAFAERIQQAELTGASTEQLTEMLGRGRAKKGMFEGEMEEGELEIGQVSGLIRDIKPAAEIVSEIIEECRFILKQNANLFD
jgi:enoyl-[acyl-carrier protein] reductase II